MLPNWYYKDGKRAIGPIDQGTLREWILERQISPALLVRREDWSDWRKIISLEQWRDDFQAAGSFEPGFCRHCGYSLRGLTKPQCPECGTAFNAEDPVTWRQHPGSPFLPRWVLLGAALLPVTIGVVSFALRLGFFPVPNYATSYDLAMGMISALVNAILALIPTGFCLFAYSLWHQHKYRKYED